MKVLISAFTPFNKMPNNYSSEVLKYINGVDKIILDVGYDECFEELKKQFNLDEYDLIIALGEARSRKVLTLEKRAINLSSCSLADNSLVLKKDEKIIPNGEEYLYTKLPIEESGIDISSDAGRFVCNNIYYHLLFNYPEKSLFIHIPECNNDDNNYIMCANIINNIINKLV
jgi:pyrrolidone-carboxylate peptidase